MEESAGNRALSNSNGGFQVGTLVWRSGVTSGPEPSVELLFCCLSVALDLLRGSWSSEG